MPADLAWAISHAHRILHWQENLFGGEMPPEWMWPLSDELDDWFAEVEQARKAKYGTDDTIEEPDDMAQNELSRGRR